MDQSKVSEAKVEKRMNKAELKVLEMESKLVEAEANCAAQTSKVKGVEAENVVRVSVATNEPIPISDGNSGESVMSLLQFPSPTLHIHLKDPIVLDTLDVNPNLGEFREIEDMFMMAKEGLRGSMAVLAEGATKKVVPKMETFVTPMGMF
ncbi:unnamed protein product [Ilex paraguariensis]|uniref:Uncharacterized protein n=1 Tax=Ilex paraguariensis TaxID=185542 RepID=A0ABC8RCR0_9AQUA